jgi:hypothetical protein
MAWNNNYNGNSNNNWNQRGGGNNYNGRGNSNGNGWNNNRGNGGGYYGASSGNNNKFYKRQTSSSVKNNGDFINHGHGSIGESKLKSDNPNAPTMAGIVKVEIDMVAGAKYWLNCWEKTNPETGQPYLSFVVGNRVVEEGEEDASPPAKKPTATKTPPKTLFNDKFKNKAKPAPQVEEDVDIEDEEDTVE